MVGALLKELRLTPATLNTSKMGSERKKTHFLYTIKGRFWLHFGNKYL